MPLVWQLKPDIEFIDIANSQPETMLIECQCKGEHFKVGMVADVDRWVWDHTWLKVMLNTSNDHRTHSLMLSVC